MSDSTRIQSGATESASPFVRKRFSAGQVNGSSFQEELLNLQLFNAIVEPAPLESASEPAVLPEAEACVAKSDEAETKPESEEIAKEDSLVYSALPTTPLPIETPVAEKLGEESAAVIREEKKEITGRPVPTEGDDVLGSNAKEGEAPTEVIAPQAIAPQVKDANQTGEDSTDKIHPDSIVGDTTPVVDGKQKDAPGVKRNEESRRRSEPLERQNEQFSGVEKKINSTSAALKSETDSVQVPIADLSSSQEETPESLDIELPRNRRAERLSKSRNDDQKVESTIVSNAVQPSDSVTTTVSYLDVTDTIPADPVALSTESTESTVTPTINAPTTTTIASVSAAAAAVSATESLQASKAAALAATSSPSSDSVKSSSVGGVVSSNSQSASGSRSTEGPTGSRATLTPYQETKLVQRVLRGLEQLSNGGGQVKLRLHPPELGTLQITLRIEANQVSAKLEVENHVAKDALLQNTQLLKDRLAEQGMQVERFEVEVRSDSGSNTPGQFGSSEQERNGSRWQSSESRFAAMNANRIQPGSREETLTRVETWSRTQGTLDLSV